MTDTSAIDLIKQCINDKKSFCFNAGAGSGKTFSLVQTVDYILKEYSEEFKTNHQKIMVITYTNAAANEIIERIGNTSLLDISTIHTRMWKLIQKFQMELVEIHLEKINQKISNYKTEMIESDYLNDDILNGYIKDKTFVNEFYKYSSLRATEYKERFNKYTTAGLISNVEKFRKYVKVKDKYVKLSSAGSKIKDKAAGYCKVEYNPLDNYDRLYKMKFSHDTLIEYSKILIEKNNIIKRIIIDQYPYILVDEFQDTNPQVVSLLALIDNFADRNCTVGYYGDTCQNIYQYGVGGKISEVHPRLEEIYEPNNRRSAKKIVELANKIRHDEYSQRAYIDTEGSASVFYTKVDDDDAVDAFIDGKIKDFPKYEEVHCLVLKNDLVAERTGFGEFYKLISTTGYYRNNYNQLSTEVLSDDIKKLGKVPLLLYKWIKLHSDIHNEELPISKYIPKEVYNNLNFYRLNQIRDALKNVPSNNLEEFIIEILNVAHENNEVRSIIKGNIGDDFELNIELVKNFMLDSLYSIISDEDIPVAESNIYAILQLDFLVMKRWYDYLMREITSRVQFHTFHGTKGLEYKNVIIVLTNSFNRKRNYYHKYFEEYSKEESYSDEEFVLKRNLLYVAVTRTKVNLRLLYVDSDYDSVKDNFENIFGEVVELSVPCTVST